MTEKNGFQKAVRLWPVLLFVISSIAYAAISWERVSQHIGADQIHTDSIGHLLLRIEVRQIEERQVETQEMLCLLMAEHEIRHGKCLTGRSSPGRGNRNDR